MRSRIEPMKKIARTLRSHRALILNYFRAKKAFSSGIVEGLNNKAKLTMRKSYGFRASHLRPRVSGRQQGGRQGTLPGSATGRRLITPAVHLAARHSSRFWGDIYVGEVAKTGSGSLFPGVTPGRVTAGAAEAGKAGLKLCEAILAGNSQPPPRDALHHDTVICGWTLKGSVWEIFLACGWFAGRLDMQGLQEDQELPPACRASEGNHHALQHSRRRLHCRRVMPHERRRSVAPTASLSARVAGH